MEQPTQAGFLAWVRMAMGVPTDALPDDSVYITYAYAVALAIVNLQLNIASNLIYSLAVYNLAGDNLINWAMDIPGSPLTNVSGVELPYFEALRAQYGVNSFTGGVVSSASDEGTSESIDVIENLKNLTLADLQNLRTPYGRNYLAFAMRVGSGWGLS